MAHDGAVVAVEEPGVRAGRLDDRDQPGHGLVGADAVGEETGAAGRADQPTVGPDQRDVGLAVAGVDGEDAGERAL